MLFLWRHLRKTKSTPIILTCTPSARGDLRYQTTSGRSTSCLHAIASALFQIPLCTSRWLVVCHSLCARVDHSSGPRLTLPQSYLPLWLVRIWPGQLLGRRYCASRNQSEVGRSNTRRQPAKTGDGLDAQHGLCRACKSAVAILVHTRIKGCLGFPVFVFVGVVVSRLCGGAPGY